MDERIEGRDEWAVRLGRPSAGRARLRLVSSRSTARVGFDGGPSRAASALPAPVLRRVAGTNGPLLLVGSHRVRFDPHNRMHAWFRLQAAAAAAARDRADPHAAGGTPADPGRDPRLTEGTILMTTLDNLFRRLVRFTVGFGVGLALVATFVIVTTDGLQPAPATAHDVVRLAPVTVRIAPGTFDAIRYPTSAPPTQARLPGAGPGEG